MEKERTLYPMDFLLCLLRKWRIIIIWMVVFAVLLNGYAIIKNYKAMSMLKQNNTSDMETSFPEEESLSGEEKKVVEEIYDVYSSYNKTYDSSKDYYNHSIKMNIDPNHVPKMLIQYRLKTTKNADEIITAFSNILHNEEVCKKIQSKLEKNVDVSYLGELITVEKDESNNEIKDSADISLERDNKINVMVIRIVAADKEMCETIANVIEEEIRESSKQLINSLGEFELTYIDSNYSESSDSDLMYLRREGLVQLNSIIIAMDNLKSSLSENQKAYLDELLEEENEEADTKNNIKESEILVDYFNIKYILVGLFAGLFISCCWFFVSYILDIHLLTIQELETDFGMHILDTFTVELKQNKKRCIIDCWINRLFHINKDVCRENKIKMVSTNIQSFAEKNNLEKIHITSVASSDEVENIKREIFKEIDGKELVVSVGNSIISDQKSLKQLASSDGVVLVERVKDSILKEVEKEVEICRNQGIQIIGVIGLNGM